MILASPIHRLLSNFIAFACTAKLVVNLIAGQVAKVDIFLEVIEGNKLVPALCRCSLRFNNSARETISSLYEDPCVVSPHEYSWALLFVFTQTGARNVIIIYKSGRSPWYPKSL